MTIPMTKFDTSLKALFPYFGGKGKIARTVWEYLGDVKQYVEPFFGSGAVLLKRPATKHEKIYEIVNDKNGFIANVWRAIQFAPDEVARWCDWPVNHADLVARRKALVANESYLLEKLCNYAEWYDAKLAGYWVWAASCWIGRQLTGPNVIPFLSDDGIHTSRPHLSGDTGIIRARVQEWLQMLSARLRNVKVVCGDWSRVCGGKWLDNYKSIGMFFDPPYLITLRDSRLYHHDSPKIAEDVCRWVLNRGSHPNYRIIVCGYAGEHAALVNAGWRVHEWSAVGGYANRSKKRPNDNQHKERLFISPHCQKRGLFD